MKEGHGFIYSWWVSEGDMFEGKPSTEICMPFYMIPNMIGTCRVQDGKGWEEVNAHEDI